ncbi:MAG: hypothetical protein K8S98_00195 [Planctomycetes bacterium]|nr:hypothetical protein [Planctomycetota bacterium]
MFLRTRRSALPALSTSLLALGASAQSGGFTPGDLYFAIAGVQAPFPDGGSGLARVDPTTGAVSVLLDLPSSGSVPITQGIAYDPFRDRIVFGGIPTSGAPLGLWAVDAAGAFQLLTADNSAPDNLIAPATSGRIYYRRATIGGRLRYVDASNVEHIVMDSAGTAPFAPTYDPYAGAMAYDAPSNSLIMATLSFQFSNCPGGGTNALNVHRIVLSADGSRAVGESCNQIQLQAATNSNNACGIGRMANGHLVIAVDPNANGVEPSFVEVDPASLALSVFASAGPNTTMKCGSYSTLLGKAYNVDSSAHTLRVYSQGGAATVFPTSVPISPSGNSLMTWMEIPPATCGGNNVALYCTAKTTSQNCVPAITTSGGASVSAGSGFTLQCHGLGANKNGLLFYSTVGALGAPYQGGTLCVKAPIKRLPPTNSGGSAACSGVLTTDFNAWIAGGHDAALIAGADVWGQFWFRDPGAASGTGLSGGVSFSLCN